VDEPLGDLGVDEQLRRQRPYSSGSSSSASSLTASKPAAPRIGAIWA